MAAVARATSSAPSAPSPALPSPPRTLVEPVRTGSTSSSRLTAGWILGRSGSTPSWIISVPIRPPTCCCSAWPTRAGSSSSNRPTRPTSTSSSRGGRSCAPWRCTVAASKPGTRWLLRWSAPPPIGTRIAIPSPGASVAGINPAASPASHWFPMWHRLGGRTTNALIVPARSNLQTTGVEQSG
jgi:hypothetical protein